MLWHWGGYSGWSNNIYGLEVLVKAVANSSLKHSLKQIGIEEWKMNIGYKDSVKEMFERHDLLDLLELKELLV